MFLFSFFFFNMILDTKVIKLSVFNAFCQYCVYIFRIIFLGLITCLSGSSYFFIIAVIIILRRQFRKPEREAETQHARAIKEIELQAPSKAAEDQPGTIKPPKVMPQAPEVCKRITVELETRGEDRGTELLAQDGRIISTNNNQEKEQLKSQTETTVDFTTPPSEQAKVENDEQKSEQAAKENPEHPKNDKNNFETEMVSKENDGPEH